jgi:monofunctional biosynthetic peptidoglycan transglycosylase
MIIGLAVVVLYGAYLAISLAMLPPVGMLADRRLNLTIQVKDWQGKYHPFVVGPKNRYWIPGSVIPAEMKWAVVLAEDANFYKHEGVDVKAIKNAIKYDLEKKSFARGASTLTQQVAKNLFLSREKTISRKVKELYLALRMEQELTKGRIIELYLNVVELGPLVYGIGNGARYYFGKSAADLTPRECAFLAAMLPGPRVAYNPYRNMAKVLRRSDMILKLLRSKGVLSDAEYHLALAEMPNISRLQKKVEESIRHEEVLPNRSSARPSPPADQIDVPAPNAGTPAGSDETRPAESPAPPLPATIDSETRSPPSH